MRQFFEKDVHLGILKGGQLGRMLLQPCMDLGIIPHIMDIDPHAPARPYCHHFTVGDALSFDAVYNFGKDLDAITLEFEHINLEALKALRDAGVKVYPTPDLIEIVQDKALQKQFYKKHGIPTTNFTLIETKKELVPILNKSSVVQKKRVAGYDGKGVVVLNSIDDLESAFDEPSVIEDKITIMKEISVLVARNQSGQIETFPTVEMAVHEHANLLDYLFSPAAITPQQEAEAVALAQSLAEQLGLVGLLAVEMFITMDGKILINEIAPRPHNSGHHTIEANTTSQFKQHIRAIFNLPLGATSFHSPAVMVNIIGEPGYEGLVVFEGMRKFLEMPGVYVHRYGKKYTKPFRKMGHITIVRSNLEDALTIAKQIQTEVKAISCQPIK